MAIIIVDDDETYANELRELLRASFAGEPGSEPDISVYTSPHDVREDVDEGHLTQSFVCILDHDFPPTEHGDLRFGHSLAHWLVEHHPRHRSLRFVYLTGRLDEQDYLSNRQGTYGPIECFFRKELEGDSRWLLVDAVRDLRLQLQHE